MFGLRSVSRARAETQRKASNTIRIICLGASTTDQITQNTRDLWSAVLDKKLQEAVLGTGFRIEVSAYGRGGHTVHTTPGWARKELADFNPDIVIILLGINDLCWGTSEPSASEPDTDVLLEKMPLWKRVLRQVSQTVRHIYLARKSFRIKRALKEGTALNWGSYYLPIAREGYRKFPYRESVTRQPDPIVSFEEGLNLLLRLLEENSIKAVVLAQPVLWKENMTEKEMKSLWFPVVVGGSKLRLSTGWLEQEIKKYNQVQQRRAAAQGAVFVPLDQRLPKSKKIFFDDCHFTDFGNKAVAEAIFEEVLEVVNERIAGRNT